MMPYRIIGSVALLAFLVSSCASGPKRPVFYPNDKYKVAGVEGAKHDVDECIHMSIDAGVETEKGKEMAQETAKEGARGAIIGGAIGLVTGDVKRSAAIGAAGGAAAGLTHKAFSRDLDPVQQRFVERCLRDKGYDPIGWK